MLSVRHRYTTPPSTQHSPDMYMPLVPLGASHSFALEGSLVCRIDHSAGVLDGVLPG